MDLETQMALREQMFRSFEDDPARRYSQDHGGVTGNKSADAIQDTVLQKAVDILREDTVFANILQKYHRDVRETQRQAKEGVTETARALE